MPEDSQQQGLEKLEQLRTQHRELDKAICKLEIEETADRLKISRLKRQKLQLKDQISYLGNSIIPDIIA